MAQRYSDALLMRFVAKAAIIGSIPITSVMSEITEVGNLLLNMMSGLLPEHLTKEEVTLLEMEFGKNWFEALGYDDEHYKRPA